MESAFPQQRLPVLATVLGSYGYVWENRRLLAIPILILAAVIFSGGLLVRLFVRPVAWGGGIQGAGFPIFLYFAAVVFVGVSVLVATHRLVLLKEEPRGLEFLRWNANSWRFIGMGLLLLIFGALVVAALSLGALVIDLVGGSLIDQLDLRDSSISHMLLSLVTEAIRVLIYVVGSLELQRVILALAAAAIGKRDGVTISWQATQDNAWRLLGASLLVTLPYVGLVALLKLATFGIAPPPDFGTSAPSLPVFDQVALSILDALFALIASIMAPAYAVMQSLAYDFLVEGAESPAPPRHD